MSGGWLGGVAYLTLCAVTLVGGTRFVFVRTPWQPTYHAVYAAFVGVVGESFIIDIDHWRHYFLILGVLWGLMAVTRAWRPPSWQRRPRADVDWIFAQPPPTVVPAKAGTLSDPRFRGRRRKRRSCALRPPS